MMASTVGLLLKKNGKAVSKYSDEKMMANRKKWKFSLSEGSAVEERNDPKDHNHPIKYTTNGNRTAPRYRLALKGSFKGPGVNPSELTIAICPVRYVPQTRTKICQCFARRKKLVIAFRLPPLLRFSPIYGRLSYR